MDTSAHAGSTPTSIQVDPNDGSTVRKHDRKHKAQTHVPELNITSFLDMSFCLLTFLIMAAKFSPDEGVLTAKLPMHGGDSETDVIEPTPESPLAIILDASGPGSCRISVQGMPEPIRTFPALTEALRRVQFDASRNPSGAYKADNPVVIRPKPGVEWQQVVNAFNAALRARYTNVAFGAVDRSTP